jgi:hypothetical protein
MTRRLMFRSTTIIKADMTESALAIFRRVIMYLTETTADIRRKECGEQRSQSPQGKIPAASVSALLAEELRDRDIAARHMSDEF